MPTESASVDAPALALPRIPCPPLAGRRVLVVEDNVFIAFEVQALLTEAGCTVVGPCRTADDAIALIDRVEINCATVDLGLCRGAGASVAFALQRRGIPFVIVTGRSAENIPAALRSCAFIQKPYAASTLLAAVEAELTDPLAPSRFCGVGT